MRRERSDREIHVVKEKLRRFQSESKVFVGDDARDTMMRGHAGLGEN